jgi:hypothetical protein
MLITALVSSARTLQLTLMQYCIYIAYLYCKTVLWEVVLFEDAYNGLRLSSPQSVEQLPANKRGTSTRQLAQFVRSRFSSEDHNSDSSEPTLEIIDRKLS